MEGCVGDGDFIDLKVVEETFDRCFLDDEPDKEELGRLTDIIKNQGRPLTRWHGGVLDEIDSIFKAHFFSDNGKKLIAGFMDLEEDNFLAQFREYSEKVVDACLQESGRRVNMNLITLIAETVPVSGVRWGSLDV
jgi:hypothetical protein